VRGINYRVVGIYDDEGSQNELDKIYIPISTAQLVYHGGDRVHAMMYTLGDLGVSDSERSVEQTREVLAERHDFAPEDRQALRVRNNLEQFQRITDIFGWVRAFVWLVGVGTLFAGIVGVGNIMLISVKERTLEFGVRKALGATPLSIVTMILQEALLITLLAGYFGLASGALVLEGLSRWLPDNDYFNQPEIDFRAALGATVLLVLASSIAGLIPAVKAATVKPVVAIRDR
jgi:putative ABC transport system permease protein